jgi:hypothetical protein
MRTAMSAACLTWEAPSADVRWRPSLAMVTVTRLVTRLLRMPGLRWSSDLLIRREFRTYPLPAHLLADLAECCSTMRSRRQH